MPPMFAVAKPASNRDRDDSRPAWVTPFILVKGSFRLQSEFSYLLEDDARANGYPALGTALQVGGNLSGNMEKLHDFANPNPYSFPTKVNQLEGRYSEGFYRTMREGGNNKLASGAMAGLWFVYVMTGVTGLLQAYEGEDVLTGQPLSDGDRISGDIAGAAQLATLGLGVKGVLEAPASAPKTAPRAPVGELPPAMPKPVQIPKPPVSGDPVPPPGAKPFDLGALTRVERLSNELKVWIGGDAKVINNVFGNIIIQSKDGLREIRFDFNHTAPHKNPHTHLIEYTWVKNNKVEVTNERIYPAGLAPE